MPASSLTIALRIQRCEAALEAERFAAAEREARAILAEDPCHAWAYVLLSRALVGQERLDEAEQAACTAVSLDPQSAYAHFRLGFFRLCLNDPLGAVEPLERATALDPGFARYPAALAVALAESGVSVARARALVAAALPEAPGDAWTLYFLAVAQHQLGEYVATERLARAAMALAPAECDFVRILAGALRLQGRAHEALMAAREAVRLAPNQCGPWTEVAYALHDLGRYPEAVQAAREALEHRRMCFDAWNILVLSLQAQGLHDQAVAAADEALASNARHPKLRALHVAAREARATLPGPAARAGAHG
jgi:tetratricopeptide (TPR) repeat protein